MNKILLVLNIVLLLAVGLLYYLYIRYTSADIIKHDWSEKRTADSFKIAYFDIDTLENYYDYSKEVRGNLMKKDSLNQSQLSKMANDINNQIRQFNLQGVSTQVQQSSFQQKLQQLQTDYEKTGQALAQSLQTESFQQIQQVRITIQKFLREEYCKEKGYAYVLSTQEYDNLVYYKDTIRNITMDLVNRLNIKYRKEHQK